MNYIDKTTNNGKVVKLKNYKRRAKINRIKRKILLILLLLIILFAILLFAPFMQIKTIKCTGNSRVLTEDIIKSSAINVGDNIIRISKRKIINSIKNASYIKNVVIDRNLPSTVTIKVEECEVYGYVTADKKLIYLDENGKILEIAANKPENNAPELKGVKFHKTEVNKIADFVEKKQLESYKELVKAINSSVFKNLVTAIDLTDTKTVSFTVNNTMKVIVGDMDNLDYKINHLAAETYKSSEVTIAVMDLRYGNTAIIKSK